MINSPELKVFVENSLSKRVANLNTVAECGHASDMIDFYEESNPESIEFLHYIRNYLCDRTFELYIEKYKPKQR